MSFKVIVRESGYKVVIREVQPNVIKVITPGVQGPSGSSGSSLPTTFGTISSPRSVSAGTGLTVAASHMSVTASSQIIFAVGSIAGENIVTANPQIQAGTSVGQQMKIKGTTSTAYLTFNDGNGLKLNGPWSSIDSSLTLIWDGLAWNEDCRKM